MIAEDNQRYDRKSIEEWFKTKSISPYNRQPIGKTLIADKTMKENIAVWRQKKKASSVEPEEEVGKSR